MSDDKIPEITVLIEGHEISLPELLLKAKLVDSIPSARQLISKHYVKMDNEIVYITKLHQLKIKSNETHIFQVGKERIARILVK